LKPCAGFFRVRAPSSYIFLLPQSAFFLLNSHVTDIVLVSRIQDALEKYGDRFLRRIFTEGERAYCEAQKYKFQHYAARFAAKEAFSKAIGTGLTGDMTWTSVEVVKRRSGEPFLRLHNKIAEKYGNCRVLVSLSHTSESALAMVAIETDDETLLRQL
jgi:holo-[acyl-carrier protein] synthase